jgi:hypothetical protein
MQVDAVSRENTKLKEHVQELFTTVNLLLDSKLPFKSALSGCSSSPRTFEDPLLSLSGDIDLLVGRVVGHRDVIADVTDSVTAFNNDLILRFDEPADADGPQAAPPYPIVKTLSDDVARRYRSLHEGTAELLNGFRQLIGRLKDERHKLPELDADVRDFLINNHLLAKDQRGVLTLLQVLKMLPRSDGESEWIDDDFLQTWIASAKSSVSQAFKECEDHLKAIDMLASELMKIRHDLENESPECSRPQSPQSRPQSPQYEKFEVQIGRLLPQKGLVGVLDPIAESCSPLMQAARDKEREKAIDHGDDTDEKPWAQDVDVANVDAARRLQADAAKKLADAAKTLVASVGSLETVAEGTESQEETTASDDESVLTILEESESREDPVKLLGSYRALETSDFREMQDLVSCIPQETSDFKRMQDLGTCISADFKRIQDLASCIPQEDSDFKRMQEFQEKAAISHDIEENAESETPMIFVTENNHLNAEGPGLVFHNSLSMEDTDEERAFVPWGSIVYGTPVCENKWLKVGRRYLPMEVNGRSVLRSPAWKPRF